MDTPEKSKSKIKLALATGITVVTILLATMVKKRTFDVSDIEKQWSVDGTYTPKPKKYHQIAHSILHLSKVR